MPPRLKRLPRGIMDRYEEKAPNCDILPADVRSLSEYYAVWSQFQGAQQPWWFRGHEDFAWRLAPSALRFTREKDRDRALELIFEFKRHAVLRLRNPPGDDELLKWIQIAQHHGLPTRLLDWTESLPIALYFACSNPKRDGAVFVLNPIDLNRKVDPNCNRVFDLDHDRDLLQRYLELGPKLQRASAAEPTIAMYPVVNTERLSLQKSVFTLHGSSRGGLTRHDTTSLMCLPILRQAKDSLRAELEATGIDEMSIFPEPEHTCRQLIRRAGLAK